MENNPILQSKTKALREKVASAPKLPGCYVFSDKNGEKIYVGKAKSLTNRVRSYFLNFHKLETKTQQMISAAHSLELYIVDSEVEALILENNLIKKYRPKYNILMRDDKNYIYVRFDAVRRKNQKPPTKKSAYKDFPTITTTRKKKNDGAEYYGPFPDSTPVKKILRRLRKIYPYCIDKRLFYIKDYATGEVYTESKKPCFYTHIGLCNGACAGLERKDDYLKRINAIKKIFSGEKQDLIKQLEKKMQLATKKLEYEAAAEIRDKILELQYVMANIRIDNDTDDVIVDEVKKQQREGSVKDLLLQLEFPEGTFKTKGDFKIECYDISNIQGKNAVGSMTVVVNGNLRPDLYRKFRIKMEDEPNDYAMMQEVLKRRFARSFLKEDPEQKVKRDESFSKLPNLIILDGGKGQLGAGYTILYSMGLHNTIPIVGLAKKNEEIFKLSNQFADTYNNQVNDQERFTKVVLPKKSESLFLVQRIRDEAHRFGVQYHRKLRSKKMLSEGGS